MADLLRNGPVERDVEQAITALKKGAHLLKYGRRGKPKFCPFRLSNDETLLIWYSGKEEKQLKLSHVSKIIPGQRTAIFQRYPRPEKEYQSFSLIYSDRSLDLICKDKDEAEVWFVGLKALISRGNTRKWRIDQKSDRASSDTSSPHTNSRKPSPLSSPFCASDLFLKDTGDAQQIHFSCDSPPRNGLGKFSDVILYTAPAKASIVSDAISNSLGSFSSGGNADNQNGRGSAVETFRVSLSSAVSSSSHGSGHEDFDALGDVFIWGEGIGDGLLGGGSNRVENSAISKIDALLPKALEPVVVLDVHSLSCGGRHAVLVTKQGEVFSWGEESGGRLGHGVDADIPHPRLIEALGGMNIELVACGEYHTCAVTMSGDLYTWGDGTHSFGLLGHGSEVSHWIPKKVTGLLDGLHVSAISCGPWHTAVVTSSGKLFTFGDGTFGVLGHGDRRSANVPREVETLKGLRTVQAACGVWHTAAVVEVPSGSPDCSHSSTGKVFTWGDGDKGRLGHGDREPRLLPACVASLAESNFCQVACGHDITVALSTSGRVYTMGSNVYGQLGCPEADGKHPTCVEGKLSNSFVEEIACGSYHVAVLTSRTEVYTWGKGANGRLGHGDNDDRNSPMLVEALKDKQVKSVVCGSNFTAVICLHKWVSSADQSMCSGCRLPFGFRRKRHNCYNCGLVFCKACSNQKSIKASLAPNINKPYRVCDECNAKLKKAIESGTITRFTRNSNQNGNASQTSIEVPEKGNSESRPHGQLSRLSSVDSFKTAENRSSKQNWKFESNNSRLTFNVSSPWGSFYSSKSSNIVSASKKIFSASVPTSRMASRATSPVTRRSSPPHLRGQQNASDIAIPEVPYHDLQKANDDPSKEIARLRLQVEDLTRKSQLLEVELEKATRQLREATTKASDETKKCKAAREVIKSLTAQLKDIAGSAEGCKIDGCTASYASNISNILSLTSNDSHMSSPTAEASGTNGHPGNPLSCNGARAPIEEAEWVEQVEPGVYITLSSFPGGEKYLKRVRFSRKRFSEQQAEKWWAENMLRLQEKYSLLAPEKSGSAPSASG